MKTISKYQTIASTAGPEILLVETKNFV